MATNWGIETDTKASTTDVWSIDGAGSQATNWESHLYNWDFMQSTWESLHDGIYANFAFPFLGDGVWGSELLTVWGGNFWAIIYNTWYVQRMTEAVSDGKALPYAGWHEHVWDVGSLDTNWESHLYSWEHMQQVWDGAGKAVTWTFSNKAVERDSD